MIKEPMIRRENRHAIEGAHLDIHRQAEARQAAGDTLAHYPVENISRGGLRFHGSDSYRIDERIEITVYLKNGESHSAMGRICYRQGDHENCCDYGVSFLDNFLEMESCLRDYHS